MTKTSALLFVSILSLVPAGAEPNNTGRIAMQDVTTDAKMAISHRAASLVDPLRQLGEPIGKTDDDPAKGLHSRDLIKESTILCFRGSLTLVPKRAVLFVPDALISRIGVQPNANVLAWADFRNANRGWIRSVEVSRDQALGVVPLSEETVAAYTKGSSIVIATFMDGPISVLPLKTPAPAESDPAATVPKP